MEIETRHIEMRLDDDAEGTIRGIAVPYGQTADIGTYQEQFAPGAIRSVEDVKLFYGHQHDDLPIGKVIEGRDTEEGFEIVAKLTKGVQRADETLALMRDGVLNKFSIGFKPVEQTREGKVITRTLVELFELSVVPWPAFAGAGITQVREEQEPAEAETEPTDDIQESESSLSENTELDVRAIQDELVEVRRLVEAGITPQAPAAPAGSKFRSIGAFAKALATGDTDAVEAARAASNSGDAGIVPPYFGYINTLIANNRPTLNAFSRAALPATGVTVEYAKINSNTLSVDVQDPEGEALAFGNLTFQVVSADVQTYGGYTSFTKQYVERSQINTLDAVFEGLAIQYATATNARMVAVLAAQNYSGKTFDADGQTASSLAEGIANGASYIFTNSGLRPEFILAAPDAYVNIVKVAAGDGRPVLSLNGDGSNTIGSANIPGLSGSVFGLPVIVDPQLASGVVYMANSAALISMESGSTRLTDSDITTLTDSVSIYGYMALAIPRFGAIVKLDVTA
jgi:HK97 family phage prohead protease/HK97 family phage major capsid protein